MILKRKKLKDEPGPPVLKSNLISVLDSPKNETVVEELATGDWSVWIGYSK